MSSKKKGCIHCKKTNHLSTDKNATNVEGLDIHLFDASTKATMKEEPWIVAKPKSISSKKRKMMMKKKGMLTSPTLMLIKVTLHVSLHDVS